MNPSTKHLLQYFSWSHLPARLADVSRPFYELAELVAHGPDNPETSAALRKLLEAKDCAVRAALAAKGDSQ